MAILKKDSEKIKKLEQKINELDKIVNNKQPADLVVQMKLFKDTKDYKEVKEILEKKGFKYIRTEMTDFRWYHNEEYEIWEKTLAETYWF